MEGINGGAPHFTFPKDISVGGIRLVSSVSPYHLDNRQILSSSQIPLQTIPPSSSPIERDEKEEKHSEKSGASEQIMVVDQEGGGGHDVKHISTTEAEIERARADLQNRHINVKSIRHAQSLLRGQGGKKQKSRGKSKQASKTKSKQGSKKKKKTNSKKAKPKSKKKTTAKKKKTSKKTKSSKKQTKKKGGKK